MMSRHRNLSASPRLVRAAPWTVISSLLSLCFFACGWTSQSDGAIFQEDQTNLEQPNDNQSPEPQPEPEWALAIHGGAGNAARDRTNAEDYYQALREVLAAGAEQLEAGEASLQVVENVVAALEDDERFNAGRGSVFTSIGTHELDAAIMDGRTLACGAVSGVKNVRNPIRLARRVMEDTPHVLLAGVGADNFGVTSGVRRNVQAYFTTERQLERYREIRAQRRAGDGPATSGDGAPNQAGDYTGNAFAPNDTSDTASAGGASHLGTVGAVAMDRYGNLAAATSTGGTMYKRLGRVGDVPVIGAGTYANNDTVAVSGTGRGEEFIRRTVAYDVSALIEYAGLSVGEAARRVIDEKLRQGDGGLIAVGPDGEIAMEFNTNAMFRGAANSLGRFEVGIWNETESGRP